MLREFREFAMKGNVVDMAIGIVVGAAFGTIVNSLVSDVIMPPFGVLLGNVDFSSLFIVLKSGKIAGPYISLAEAKAAGAVTINYGVLINAIISFLIVAFAMFMVVRSMNRLRKKQVQPVAASTTKECPFCHTAIPLKAVRCPNCTSQLESVK